MKSYDEQAVTNHTTETEDERDLTKHTEAMQCSKNPQDMVLMMEPMTLEVEINGTARRFVHKITASYPFQVIVAGQTQWLGRKSKIGLTLIFFVLIILTIAIPTSRRKSTRSGEELKLDSDNPEDPKGSDDDRDIGVVVVGGDFGSDSDERVPESRTSVLFRPFSVADPADFFPVTERPEGSRPSSRLSALQESHTALPTNAWYQNLLLLRDGESPTGDHRAYTQPYVVDVAGPIPGLRMQLGQIDTTSDQVIVADGVQDSLTLGMAPPSSPTEYGVDMGYNVAAANDLGLTLEWTYFPMRSSIVRGMPYVTMTYPSRSGSEAVVLPTIFMVRGLSGPILVDGGVASANCGSSFSVDTEMVVTLESGVTYMIFLSSPELVSCLETSDGGTMLQILHGAQTEALIVRAAVVIPSPDVESYCSFLRTYSNVFPGEGTSVGYEFGTDQAALVFDWDPQMSREDTGNQDLIMFAMPHHQDRLSTVTDHCASVLLGSVCLIVGSQWNILETLPPISFRAPRGPDASMLPALMDAVANDLTYRVPDNYMRGAGDTYFSGKAMAKLARILLITGEILEICEQRRLRRGLQSTVACGDGVLPDRATLEEGIAHLKAAVDIWLSQGAEAPFVFDNAWGGIVSCGCDYSGGFCQNEYPNCPGLSDQGLNFGAGFYNDHHFHYGYHIYAAATIAHFDPEWGRDNFEAVLLLVRDIANPSLDDPFFPQARHKDWFHGSSWASGISLPVSPTGMNQESSSEAIAGYEAVALFGKTMASIFTDETSKAAATDIYQFGRLLAATELRSTKRYWQVSREDSILEDPYQHNVVGILWSSKLFFGTWFGNYPYFIYGIQLMPLTPISEERDELDWIREAFDPYASACDGRCVAEGWSVQILALLATLGQKEKAMGHAQDLGASTFESAGGSGHSLSNTLWYIATRPPTDEPITLDQTYAWEAGPLNVTCLQPETCTAAVLDSLAGDSTCRTRITYLVNTMSKSEYEACYQVAVTEYPGICGACTPASGSSTVAAAETSAPSTLTCNKPNTCTADVLGASAGGFSCGDRIEYVMARGMSEVEACRTVAAYEFPSVCGGCDPD